MASIIVTHQRRSPDGSRIERLEGRELGFTKEWTREQLVREVDTRFPGGVVTEGGARIRVVVIGHEKFLRTDSNRTEGDNLGNLPHF